MLDVVRPDELLGGSVILPIDREVMEFQYRLPVFFRAIDVLIGVGTTGNECARRQGVSGDAGNAVFGWHNVLAGTRSRDQ